MGIVLDKNNAFTITDNKGNLEVEHLHNEYGHLIKTITTFSDIPSSKSEIVYEIEYY